MRMKRRKILEFKKSSRGFTLLEFSIATALGLVLVMAVMSLDVFTKRNFVINSAFTDTHSAARVAMDWLTKDIRQAKQILRSKSGYSTTDSQIVLEVPAIDANGVMDSLYDYIVYRPNPAAGKSNQLQRIIIQAASGSNRQQEINNGLQTRTIMTFLSSMNFMSEAGVGLGDNSLDVTALKEVKVTLNTTKKTLDTGSVNEDLKSKIQLRNHD